MTMENDIVLRCEKLQFGHERPLCAPLDWEVHAGEIWAVAGSNGCGKTTLLRTLLGFLRPLSGTLERTKSCSYLAQSAESLVAPARVEDVVYLGAETGLSGLIPFYRRRFAKTVERLLDSFELRSLRNRSIHETSPGERQRTLLAQSIVRSPELVCLDEATSAMDPQHTRDSFAYLVEYARQSRCAVVAISHSLYAQIDQFTHLLAFTDGRCMAGKRDEVLAQCPSLGRPQKEA